MNTVGWRSRADPPISSATVLSAGAGGGLVDAARCHGPTAAVLYAVGIQRRANTSDKMTWPSACAWMPTTAHSWTTRHTCSLNVQAYIIQVRTMDATDAADNTTIHGRLARPATREMTTAALMYARATARAIATDCIATTTSPGYIMPPCIT